MRLLGVGCPLKLIVHIGHGKTGSSSIQGTLLSQPAVLAEANTAYVGLNWELAPKRDFSWQRPDGWGELLALNDVALVEQVSVAIIGNLQVLQAQGIERVIWSNESLFSSYVRYGPAIDAVRQRMGIDVQIVCYLRRHDAWARSAYMQWGVKHKAYAGRVKTFGEWIEHNSIDFSRHVRKWLRTDWDEFSLRNFDACDDVVGDFLAVVGLADSGLSVVRDNDSPSATALALWALYNSQSPEPVLPAALQSFLSRSGLLNKPVEGFDVSCFLPSSKQLQAVLDRSAGDVAAVSELFERFGQPPVQQVPMKERPLGVDTSQLIAALLDICRTQDHELQQLKQRLTRLERRVNSESE